MINKKRVIVALLLLLLTFLTFVVGGFALYLWYITGFWNPILMSSNVALKYFLVFFVASGANWLVAVILSVIRRKQVIKILLGALAIFTAIYVSFVTAFFIPTRDSLQFTVDQDQFVIPLQYNPYNNPYSIDPKKSFGISVYYPSFAPIYSRMYHFYSPMYLELISPNSSGIKESRIRAFIDEKSPVGSWLVERDRQSKPLDTELREFRLLDDDDDDTERYYRLNEAGDVVMEGECSTSRYRESYKCDVHYTDGKYTYFIEFDSRKRTDFMKEWKTVEERIPLLFQEFRTEEGR